MPVANAAPSTGVQATQHLDGQWSVKSANAAPVTLQTMDLDSLRLGQDYAATLGVKKLITTVRVNKPGKQTWFQVHPEFEFPCAVLELKDDTDRGVYMVSPAIRDELALELKAVLLVVYIDRQNNVGIWPIPLPGTDGRTSDWHTSANRAAQEARHGWVRMVANMSGGYYDLSVTTADLPPPKWPDKTLKDLIDVAFKDRFIASMDHPIVRKLQGLS